MNRPSLISPQSSPSLISLFELSTALEMASKASLASVALFLSLKLLFFSLVTSTHVPCAPVAPNYHEPASCPKDTLKLGVCAGLLGLVNVIVGSPPTLPCCSLLQGLADLEAAVCLCTAIKANVLGINLNIPLSLSLLLNVCGKEPPSDFQCA